jgi:hypothetical protein
MNSLFNRKKIALLLCLHITCVHTVIAKLQQFRLLGKRRVAVSGAVSPEAGSTVVAERLGYRNACGLAVLCHVVKNISSN